MTIRWHKWKDGLLLALAIVIVFFVAFCAEHKTPRNSKLIPWSEISEPASAVIFTRLARPDETEKR